MRESYIKKLIRLVERSDIASLEVSSWGRRVKITQSVNSSTNGANHNPAVVEQVVKAAPQTVTSQPNQSPPTSEPQPVPVAETEKSVAIKSPMVGTFYAAPAPDADPYVSINQKVNAGQVVCIIEAMKLMNEIESEYSGRVVKILAENGKPVEFGQELFLVEPD